MWEGPEAQSLDLFPLFINLMVISFSLVELNATCLSLGLPRRKSLIKGLHAGSLYGNEILESRNEGQGQKKKKQRRKGNQFKDALLS